MQLVSFFLVGLVFGLGLILSGLTDPGKVLAFLDLAGAWDPSLLFTMGGAVLVTAAGFRLARQRGRALFGAPIRFPAGTGIDRRLVLGSGAVRAVRTAAHAGRQTGLRLASRRLCPWRHLLQRQQTVSNALAKCLQTT